MEIGIDLVEHKDLLGKEERLAPRLLSEAELEKYHSFTSPKRKLEYLASRFAVKEAIFKVYKKGDLTLNFNEISVLNHEDGSPYISSTKIKAELKVSLSHTDNYSVAIVVKNNIAI